MSFLLDQLTPDRNHPDLISQLPTERRGVDDPKRTHERVAVIGLGYVGLPLAVHIAEEFETVIGLDISPNRVRDLREGRDTTNEIAAMRLVQSGLSITQDVADIKNATFYIVTVPTPITSNNQPDLTPLVSACEALGPALGKGDIVVFESTVYPGVTEEVCGPILERTSGLSAGGDFFLGYSPERINPGDKVNTLDKITKIVAGDSPETLNRMVDVYSHVISAGLHPCSSIRVAEGAKVLENTQRDVNIALMNELSLICDKVGIETQEVIDAAATKWNFVPYTPGLVGGHCIGVDPYYLASLAERVGLHPQVILSGRRINDGMVSHVANTALRFLINADTPVRHARVGVFGISFKEDVPDIRNSKGVELVDELSSLGLSLQVHDPFCPKQTAQSADIELSDLEDMNALDLMIVASPHRV